MTDHPAAQPLISSAVTYTRKGGYDQVADARRALAAGGLRGRPVVVF